jgi:hypothetical protein
MIAAAPGRSRLPAAVALGILGTILSFALLGAVAWFRTWLGTGAGAAPARKEAVLWLERRRRATTFYGEAIGEWVTLPWPVSGVSPRVLHPTRDGTLRPRPGAMAFRRQRREGGR